MKYFLSLLLLFFISFSHAQSIGSAQQLQPLQLTNNAEISVITCGPGNEIYTAFGHSAFRIQDSALGLDRVYNYGVFDFNTPNFALKFAQGNLLYLLATGDFGRFLRSYKNENRWVKGQVLDLEPQAVQACFDFLENNALPENRAYLYDYFFDNCSTRLYQVIDHAVGNQLVIPETFDSLEASHRSLIQPYLTEQPWGDFGIDIALGSIIDRDVSMEDFLFLPENVLTFFDALQINDNGVQKPIVKRTEDIILAESKPIKSSLLSPFILFSILGLFVVFTTRKDIQNKKRSRWLDFSLFFITGLIGLVLSLIWFATDHAAAANNFNVLWAFAPNLFVSFILLKKELPNWIKKYVLILILFQAIVVILWVFRIQVFSNAVLPVLVLSTVRYYYLRKFA